VKKVGKGKSDSIRSAVAIQGFGKSIERTSRSKLLAVEKDHAPTLIPIPANRPTGIPPGVPEEFPALSLCCDCC